MSTVPATRRRRAACRSSVRVDTLLVILLLLSVVTCPTHASVYVRNETYASLPALFGSRMVDGHIYQARMQFFHKNPFLCDFDNETTPFIQPVGPETPNEEIVEPVVLLVSRGHCPFQRKAAVAERIDPRVEFMIVYNYKEEQYANEESEDLLVPMYSELGDTRLALLSVSYRTGQTLKRLIHDAPPEVLNDGGPIIFMDSIPPEGLLSVQDLRNMMLSALALFFMLISVSGCIMIVAGTYGHMHGSRIILTANGTPVIDIGGDQEHGTTRTRRHRDRGLLTEEQVRKLNGYVQSDLQDSSAAAAGDDSSAASNNTAPSTSCAVCIDDFSGEEDEGTTIVLPCRHKFHASCVTPWLTERQAKCPLCKYDVMEYVERKEQEEGPVEEHGQGQFASPRSDNPASWISRRLGRTRWMRLVAHDGDQHVVRDGIMIGPEEMVIPGNESIADSSNHHHELELTQVS